MKKKCEGKMSKSGILVGVLMSQSLVYSCQDFIRCAHNVEMKSNLKINCDTLSDSLTHFGFGYITFIVNSNRIEIMAKPKVRMFKTHRLFNAAVTLSYSSHN